MPTLAEHSSSDNKTGRVTGLKLLVARTGFEPVISALRGRRPEPLDERAN